MRTNLKELRSFLQIEFEKKKNLNKAYSQNAFARDLGIPSSTLSSFLNGEREMNYKNLDSVFRYLNSDIHCSFCGNPKKETTFTIAGPRNLYICNECIDTCNRIAKEHNVFAKNQES